MKKTLLILALIFSVAFSANAQRRHTVTRTYKSKHTYTTSAPRPRPRPRTRPWFQRPDRYFNDIGEVRLHVGGELGIMDLGGIFMHEAPRHYDVGGMAELQAGRMLSLGLGADFYGSRGMDRDQFTSDEYLNCVPVYGMVRLSTPGNPTKLFVEARAGYAIPINQVYANRPGRNVVAQGFYTGAGIGLGFYGSNLSVGFNSIDLRPCHTMHNCSSSTGMFTDVYLRYSYAIPLN